MWKYLWRTAFLCAVLAALVTASSRNAAPAEPAAPDGELPEAVLSDAAAKAPLTLCLVYYDARGQFISVELTDGVTLDPDTGDAVLPIRSIPDGAAKMKVFLFDENLRELAPVTEGDF